MNEEMLREMQTMLIEKAHEELSNNCEQLCTAELGEVVDIIKDIEETFYYAKITEAMNAGAPITIKK